MPQSSDSKSPEVAAPRSRRRRVFLVVLFNLALLVPLYACAEVVVRCVHEGGLRAGLRSFAGPGAVPEHLGTGDWLVPDSELGYALDASKSEVNTLGIRHSELTAPKPPGVFRVLVLGDSVAWPRAGFVSMLRDGLDRGFEVINASVPGYTTWQERLAFERFGSAIEPDLVVLQYCLNDNHRFLHRLDADDKLLWTQEARRAILPQGGSRFARFQRWSYVAVELRLAWMRASRSDGGRFPWEGSEDFGAAWQEDSWEAQREHLAAMRSLAEGLGARLAVVAVPYEPQLDAALLASDREYVLFPQRSLREACAAEGIAALDVHGALLGEPVGTYFTDRIHLTPEGHEVVAKELRAFLDGAGLLDNP